MNSLLAGRRILVLDDERDVRDLIGRLLEYSGASVDRVATTEEAIRSIEAHLPDVILSDITLEHEDGFAFVQLLRSHPLGDVRRLPVVAMTAHMLDEYPQWESDSGFQAHLTKPFSPRELVEVVLRLSRSESETAHAPGGIG